MKIFRRRDAVTLMQTMLIVGIVFLVLFVLLAVPFYSSYKQKKAISSYRTLYSTLQQANKLYSLVHSVNMNEYDTTLPINVFAEKYFTPYLSISTYCKGSQDDCWKSPQYKDLKNNKMFDKVLYSIVLADKSVIGFHKSKDELFSLIVDVDGPVGYNQLGKDVFVFYIYNNNLRPKRCPDEIYSKYNISDGIHLGGYDKCGIPHDVYGYMDFVNNKVDEGCSKKAELLKDGLGVGAGCGALISKTNWVIDKVYPW